MLVSKISAVLLFFAGMSAHAQCVKDSFEGEVKYGQVYRHPVGKGLEFVLDPLASGWLIRVLPPGPRPSHDFAELATPPYLSVTPLALSTDYSFRAQDVLAWNPRKFRFATSQSSFRDLLTAYTAYMSSLKDPKANRSAEGKLTLLVQGSASAELRILDSRLIAGTANQAGLAATVASHLAETPHTVEEPNGVEVSPLGRVTWIRFKVDVWTPAAVKVEPKVTVCP